jgi:hypothetical protein
MITPEQLQWIQSTFEINVKYAEAVKHAEVDTKATTDIGMKPKARMDEYEGEYDKVAWRAPAAEPELRENKTLVTRKLSDEEVAEGTYSADSDGKLVNRDGKVIEDGDKQLMTISPETGDMTVGSAEQRILRTMNEDGTPSDNFELVPRNGYTAAMNKAKASGGKLRVENPHHSSVSQGKDVASAGHVDTKDGKVTRIDNSSGHYRPAFENLLQAVEHLLKTGAMLDTSIVDKDGNQLEVSNPSAFKLYQKTQSLILGLAADKAAISGYIAGSEAGTDDGNQAKALQTYEKKLTLIQSALDAMKKMGIGPANKITGQVDFTFAKSDGNGASFRGSGEIEKLSSQEFLMGKAVTADVPPSAPLADESAGVSRPSAQMTDAFMDEFFADDDDEEAAPTLNGEAPLTDAEEDALALYDDAPLTDAEEAVPTLYDEAPLTYDEEDALNALRDASDGVSEPSAPLTYDEEDALNALRDASDGVSEPSAQMTDAEEDAPRDASDGAYRDFGNKKKVLEELKALAAKEKLRPEDRENAAELVRESVAPEIDEAEWQKNVETLLSTAKELSGDDMEAPFDRP